MPRPEPTDGEPREKRLTLSSVARGVAHIPNFFKLFTRLMTDSRVPLITKLIPGAAFAYFMLPIDFLPDFAPPLLGYIEDFAIMYIAFRFLFKAAPQPVVREHVRRIEMKL